MSNRYRSREFTVEQVALMCGVAPSTVRTWIKRNHIRKSRCGTIPGPDVIEYLRRRGTRGQHTDRRAAVDAQVREVTH